MNLPYNGGYRYRSSRRRRRSHSYRPKHNRSRRRRMSSIGLSRGKTYSGGNSLCGGLPTGYSLGGTQQEAMNGAVASPPPVHPYNSCIN